MRILVFFLCAFSLISCRKDPVIIPCQPVIPPAPTIPTTYTFSGVVLDCDTDLPIENVKVDLIMCTDDGGFLGPDYLCDSILQTVFTNQSGEYSVSKTRIEKYRFEASKDGYWSSGYKRNEFIEINDTAIISEINLIPTNNMGWINVSIDSVGFDSTKFVFGTLELARFECRSDTEFIGISTTDNLEHALEGSGISPTPTTFEVFGDGFVYINWACLNLFDFEATSCEFRDSVYVPLGDTIDYVIDF